MTIAATAPTWTLGELMWKARKDAGLEQADVAAALGVSRALVSRWERDLSDPGVRLFNRFADLTNAQWLRTEFRWSVEDALQDVRDGYGESSPHDLIDFDAAPLMAPLSLVPPL